MNMKTCKLLFQGDSITDADRVREDPLDLGTGYPYYAAQLLRAQHPDVDFTFWNRGIGCDETQNLLARIETDLVALQPDVVSLLIGINDTWHHADARDWMPLPVFEARYREILERIRKETNAKLMVIEQYLFPVPDKTYFAEDLAPKQACVRALAQEYADVFLPAHELAQQAAGEHDSNKFPADGVHLHETGTRCLEEAYAAAIAPLL